MNGSWFWFLLFGTCGVICIKNGFFITAAMSTWFLINIISVVAIAYKFDDYEETIAKEKTETMRMFLTCTSIFALIY
jgi:hypothetical protein